MNSQCFDHVWCLRSELLPFGLVNLGLPRNGRWKQQCRTPDFANWMAWRGFQISRKTNEIPSWLKIILNHLKAFRIISNLFHITRFCTYIQLHHSSNILKSHEATISPWFSHGSPTASPMGRVDGQSCRRWSATACGVVRKSWAACVRRSCRREILREVEL